eukprot:GEMP01032910.1.p1 GENE.GEMP01032910.1~~GEMP01032910.1.p1  ORF type:complete len:324 (+),score=52.10 GEMP01032910.1:91-1062(+)
MAPIVKRGADAARAQPEEKEKNQEREVAPKIQMPPGVLDPSIIPNHTYNQVKPSGMTVLPVFFFLSVAVVVVAVVWVLIAAKNVPEPQRAFLVIDVQDCYMENNTYSGRPGSAAVQNASLIVEPLNALRRWDDSVKFFALTLTSLVAHPENHISFASTHDVAVDSEIELHCKTVDNKTYPYYSHSAHPTLLGANPNIKCCNATSAETLCACSEDDCVSVIQTVHADNCIATVDGVFAKNLWVKSEESENVIVIRHGVNPFLDTHSIFYENMREVGLETLALLRSRGVEELYFAGVGYEGAISRAVQDALTSGIKVFTFLKILS